MTSNKTTATQCNSTLPARLLRELLKEHEIGLSAFDPEPGLVHRGRLFNVCLTPTHIRVALGRDVDVEKRQPDDLSGQELKRLAGHIACAMDDICRRNPR